MNNQDDVLLDAHGLEPGIEIALMVLEAIRTVWRGTRVSHSDKIRGQASAKRNEVGNDVSPKIGWRRVAVQEDDRIPLTDVHVGHICVKDRNSFPIRGIFGRYRCVLHRGL